jgi:hypothetical protein
MEKKSLAAARGLDPQLLVRGLAGKPRPARGASVSTFEETEGETQEASSPTTRGAEQEETEDVPPPKRVPPKPEKEELSSPVIAAKRPLNKGPPPLLPTKPRTSSFSASLPPRKAETAPSLQRLASTHLPFVSLDQVAEQQVDEKKGSLAGLKKMGKMDTHFRESKTLNDQVFLWSEESFSPNAFRINLGGVVNVSSVVAGKSHFLLLTDSGKVFSWGSGKFGALGHGDTLNSGQPRLVEFLARKSVVHSICAGGCQSGAVSVENQAFLWGESGSKSIVTPALCPLDVKGFMFDLFGFAADKSSKLLKWPWVMILLSCATLKVGSRKQKNVDQTDNPF